MKTIYQDRYAYIIQQLINARKQHALTQAQLATRLNKPQSYIAKIEGKERKLDILEFLELCSLLDIKASEIILHLESNK